MIKTNLYYLKRYILKMKILLSILGEKREREMCTRGGGGVSVLFFSRFLNMICIWEQQVATLEERPLTVPQFFFNYC